jgi:hypothetical protein
LNDVSPLVDRKLIRKELNTEALLISGFTEAQLVGLGDLGEISTDRLHELLWSKLGEPLGRATNSHNPQIELFGRKKTLRKQGKSRRRRK